MNGVAAGGGSYRVARVDIHHDVSAFKSIPSRDFHVDVCRQLMRYKSNRLPLTRKKQLQTSRRSLGSLSARQQLSFRQGWIICQRKLS
jgi:hypothetical protein